MTTRTFPLALPWTSRVPWRWMLVSLLAGVLGVWLGLWVRGVAIHAQQDHQALHELAAIEIARQQAQQKGQAGQAAAPAFTPDPAPPLTSAK